MNTRATIACWLAFCVCLALPPPLRAETARGLSVGEMVYVPAYSHIYSGDRERVFLLTVTLSIRNIDPRQSITVTKVDYYETQGKFLKRFLATPISLKPLESVRYIVPEQDKSGGSGANFLVSWQTGQPANPPLIEAVMIGTQSQQGISFTSRGRVILPSD